MYLFFDTETTGLSRSADHVVQVAWILTDSDGNIESQECHVIQPEGYSIPWEAAQIHGITTAIAEEIGEPLNDVLESLSEDVQKASVVVAHNLSFDLGILQNDYKNASIPFPFHGKTQICTMKLSTTWCRLPKLNRSTGFKWPKLEELHYRLFGEAFGDAHDALADTQACMRCYFELVELEVISPPIRRAQGEVRSTGIKLEEHKTSESHKPVLKKPDRASDLQSGLRSLAKSENPMYRFWAAAHPDCPVDLLMELAEDEDEDVQRAVIGHAAVTSEILLRIKYDSDGIAMLIAKHPRCPLDLFDLWVGGLPAEFTEGDVPLMSAIAANSACPSGILRKIWLWGAYDEVLEYDDAVGLAIAANPSCPPDILSTIWWFAQWDGAGVLARANPSFSIENYRLLLEGELNKDLINRTFVAERTDCPPDILTALSCDKSLVVREYVALNPSTPEHVLLSIVDFH